MSKTDAYDLEGMIKDSAIQTLTLAACFDEREQASDVLIKVLTFHLHAVAFSHELREATERFVYDRLQAFLASTQIANPTDMVRLYELVQALAPFAGIKEEKENPHGTD